MQKITYLKYFRKTDSTTKPTQQSFDNNLTPLDEENTDNQNYSSIQNIDAQNIEPLQPNLFYPLKSVKEKEIHKSLHLHNITQKSKHIKNIRVHNNSSQVIKRRKQTEGNQQTVNNLNNTVANLRNKSFQVKANATISEGVKPNKLFTNSHHSPQLRKQSLPTYQRLKTLQSASLYDPCLTQQKFFTSPIKPYDRNKTAHNKKFRTLKTTFGDLNSSCRNYNDEYTMSLQNLRMGWRIVNAKSMIQEYLNSTYFTYHLYNGNMINKEKMKNKDNKDKKKINFKQMKNVYKVFFNKNILFNTKEDKQSNILQSIHKKDQVQQYILNQSQINVKSKQSSFCTPNQQDSRQNSPESPGKRSRYHTQNEKNSHKLKPCFFRKTYGQPDKSFNKKICQKSKNSKHSKSIDRKQENSVRKRKLDTEPNQVEPEEDNFRQNQIFGKGNIIIEIKNISIQANPSIKKQDILVFQVMAKSRNVSSNGISTPPMKYSEIKNGVKFAIDAKLGDFVPLKIWKYHGLNLVQLGIVDLNLMVFRNRKRYFDFQSKIQNQTGSDGIQDIQLYKQQRVSELNHQKQERQILFYHTKQKLRKNKKVEIEVTVSLDCLIYNKKFTKQKPDKADMQDKQNLLEEDPSQQK